MALEAVQAQAGHRLDRVHPGLPAPGQRLAGRGVPARGRADRRRCRRRRRDAGRARRWPSGERAARPRPAAAGRCPAASPPRSGPQIRGRGTAGRRRRSRRYLQRLAAFLAPGSVDAAENALRQFARWMIADAGLDSIAAVRRDDIEDYKVWLAAQPRAGGQAITAETHRQRMRTVRAVLRADHRVGLARCAAPQPGHRRGHPEKARAAAQVPRRPRRRQADGRRPGQRRPPRPARRRAAGPHRDAGRRAAPTWTPTRSSRSAPGTGCASRSASSATTATSRCTPSSSSCSPPGPPPTSSTSAAASA